jgi:hypothetical protein
MKLQAIKGLLDYWRKDHRIFYPFGFAMNGQTSRLEATRQIIHALKIENIVETGTFRGTTTEWFAQFGIPVDTVEVYERNFIFSKERLAKLANVRTTLDSSVSFLTKRAPSSARHLFYLDAHWENYLPLRDELRLISDRYPNAIVLIDDFQVPGDDGYGYDNYGVDNALTLEYVAHSNLPPFSIFLPATPAREETGFKRGWVVLTTNPVLAAQLGTISLLRPHKETIA